ncbi:MAG: STM3941 family protein [Erysipelotrichaceae bacterium]|nr:STM3941 family protein [Erysipelotrichaceae bacterium]
MIESIYIKKNNKRILLMILGCLIFIVCALFFFYLANTSFKRYEVILIATGLLSFVFFGGMAIFYISLLLSNKPFVKADSQGFMEHTTAINWGIIDWNDIEIFILHQSFGSYFIQVKVKNLSDYQNKLNPLSKILSSINTTLMSSYDIVIHCPLIDQNPHKLCFQLNQYLQSMKTKKDDKSSF